MPQTAFRDISRLKLPFPLIFELTKGKKGPRATKGKSRRPKQLCGVYEFSAPEGQIFMPHWMMEGMRVKEGGKVSLISVFDLPKGVNMVLQPHKVSFLDLAAAFGTKELLEQAMRNYSALTAGETIAIDVAGERHKVNILDVTPKGGISLLGNLDLEVDFIHPDAPWPPEEDAGGGGGGGGGIVAVLKAHGATTATARPTPVLLPIFDDSDCLRTGAPGGIAQHLQ